MKQPYFGFYGFITGKAKWGETVEETAQRELEEESGLTADLKLVGVKHKMDYDNKGKILEDKYFFVFKASNPKGELKETFDSGENIWLAKKEINKLPDLFDGVNESMEMVGQNKFIFSGSKYTVSGY